MNRGIVIRLLVALLAVGAVAWLASATEWVEIDVDKPARGAAAKNRLHAAQSLLSTLGVTVVKRQDLETMPPPQGRLVLVSRHWDLFPERGKRLREWVEQGGHLVIPGSMADHKQLRDWLPIAEMKKAEPAPTKPPAAKSGPDRDCRLLTEPESVPATYADSRSYQICVPRYWVRYAADSGHVAQWSLESPLGTEMLRVSAGKGSVTVVGPWRLLENNHVLRADNPLAVAALLQVRDGTQVWFVAEEAREPFLSWLWQEAWPAIMLMLLALALFLWRGAVRFGPLAASAERHRRSMTEQVGGTAHFLQRHGAAALHGAQLRALHETAERHIRNYARMDAFKRAQALADATGVERQAIARALMVKARGPNELPADLEILETVRRRLGRATPSTASTAPTPPSS